APDQAAGGVIEPSEAEPSEAERRAREAENLRAVFDSLREPKLHGPKPDDGGRSSHTGRAAAGAAGAGLLFILGKAKFFGLFAGLVKFKTLATMLLSIGAYAVEWGWLFAAGFVLLIFVHEMGHAVAMRHEGIPAGAPVFIPFVGAFIAMHDQPRNAAVEARVALAGPVAGSLAAWATLWAGVEVELPLLRALGHTAVLINLFNLVPVSPLDGGRVVMAFTRAYWLIGYAVGLGALAHPSHRPADRPLVAGAALASSRARLRCAHAAPAPADRARVRRADPGARGDLVGRSDGRPAPVGPVACVRVHCLSGGADDRDRQERDRLATHPRIRRAHAARPLHARARRGLAGRAAAAKRRGAGLVLGRGRSRPRRSIQPPVHARAGRFGRCSVAALVRGRLDELRGQLCRSSRGQRARRAGGADLGGRRRPHAKPDLPRAVARGEPARQRAQAPGHR